MIQTIPHVFGAFMLITAVFCYFRSRSAQKSNETASAVWMLSVIAALAAAAQAGMMK